jgi:hypothetical protein
VKRKLAGIIAVAMSGVFALAAAPPALASGPELCGCGGPALAVGVDAAGTDFVFYAGSDFGLWEKWSSYGQYWSADSTQGLELLTPQALGEGALVTSTPALAVHANGEQDVFWQGEDNDLYEYSYLPSSGWQNVQNLGSLAPNGTPVGPLTAGVDANGNDYLFWNYDGALWEKWNLGGVWHVATAILTPPAPGFLGTPVAWYLDNGPAVAVHANGVQDVFWQGYGDGQTWESSYANGSWSTPSPPGFGPSAPVSAWPAAGADANGNDYVFWTANGALYENWRLNGVWNGGPNGHQLLSAPQYDSEIPAQVAVHANGEQDVFWVQQSPETALMEYYYVNGAWHGPVDLGGL